MPTAFQIRDQDALYFLTFQVVGWADVFTRKELRDIVIDSLVYSRKNKGLKVYAYVIMSNHVHIILQSKKSDLSGAIRDVKKHTAKQIFDWIDNSGKESRKDWLNLVFAYHAKKNKRSKAKQLWTHENHAVELSTNDMIDYRVNYIHENPVKAGLVENAEEYLYSSARNFSGLDAPMIIDEL